MHLGHLDGAGHSVFGEAFRASLHMLNFFNFFHLTSEKFESHPTSRTAGPIMYKTCTEVSLKNMGDPVLGEEASLIFRESRRDGE